MATFLQRKRQEIKKSFDGTARGAGMTSRPPCWQTSCLRGPSVPFHNPPLSGTLRRSDGEWLGSIKGEGHWWK